VTYDRTSSTVSTELTGFVLFFPYFLFLCRMPD